VTGRASKKNCRIESNRIARTRTRMPTKTMTNKQTAKSNKSSRTSEANQSLRRMAGPAHLLDHASRSSSASSSGGSSSREVCPVQFSSVQCIAQWFSYLEHFTVICWTNGWTGPTNRCQDVSDNDAIKYNTIQYVLWAACPIFVWKFC